MTPEEILSVFGVDVSKLSAPYSSYHIATSQDLWLCNVGTLPNNNDPTGVIDVRVGDLIIITPDNYRSNIYAYKIPSRHVNLTGPDVYFFVYHPAYITGTLRVCATHYLDAWANSNVKGTMTFILDNKDGAKQVFISYYTVAIKELEGDWMSSSLDVVFTKWGERVVVQNYMDSPTPGFISCGFVGD
jgi:hypothetical protein